MHSIFKTRVDLDGKPIDDNAEKGGWSEIIELIFVIHSDA